MVVIPEESGCKTCGLPARRGSPYCCYGCEIAHSLQADANAENSRLFNRLILCALLSMFIMMLSLFLFAEDVYTPPEAAGFAWMRSAYRIISAVLATPIMLLLGAPLLGRTRACLAARRLSMEVLVGIASAAAYCMSWVNIVRGHGGVYFDSASTGLVLWGVGRYLESKARSNASGVVGARVQKGLGRVRARSQTNVENRNWEWLGPAEIQPGMEVWVEADQVVPVDCVLSGTFSHGERADINLGVLTGSLSPVSCSLGSPIPAGAVAVGQAITCVVARSVQESTVERLCQMAKSLQEARTKVQRMADALAGVLTPIVGALAVALVVFGAARGNTEDGLLRALSVTLIACPCTYGVSTPLVLWLAMRRALENGVSIRNARTVEELARVRHLAFDKTGTLTKSQLSVETVNFFNSSTEELVSAAIQTMEANRSHPVAKALVAWSDNHPAPGLEMRQLEVVPGGIIGTDRDGLIWILGSAQLLRDHGISSTSLEATSERAFLARNGAVLAVFVIAEELRAEAFSSVNELRALGVTSSVLTGDSELNAKEAAQKLGIHAHGRLLPEDKVRLLQEWKGRVAMVGDGVNDVPALATVGPSFSMDAATGLAQSFAQVQLLRDDLRLVPWTIMLARRTLRIAWENLLGSTVYNLVFLALAAAGHMKPVWAGVSMLTSSMLTLLNSLRVTAIEDSNDGATKAMQRSHISELKLEQVSA